MKFYLASSWGDLHGLAGLLKAQGHDVQLHIEHGPAQAVGEGLVPRAKGAPTPPPGSVVIFDTSGRGRLGQVFRARHGVIGGNPIDKALEIDRTKATALFRAHGLKVPETHTFTSIGQGRTFLATHPGHFFFKPNGNLSTSDTYDGDRAEGLSRFLAYYEKANPGLQSFELQKAVEGIECSTEGYFDGKRFVPPFNCTFEIKYILPNGKGSRTGGEANFVWVCTEERPALAAPLLKMAPFLRAHGFQGFFDLNNIWLPDGTARTLEASPRVGIPAIHAYLQLVKGDLGAQLDKLSRGKLDAWDVHTDRLGLALVVSVPPYPVEKEDVATTQAIAKKKAGLPLDPILLTDPKRYMLDDVKQGADGPVLAGRDGKVVTLGVTAPTAAAARERILAYADALDIPKKQYNPDPVSRAERDWKALRALGLLGAGDAPTQSLKPSQKAA